jgi:hypothetical protein
MIDFFDVQPKTNYDGIVLTDITKLLGITNKSDLDKYIITVKMDPYDSFNDVAYKLYGDDKLFWILQDLNKRLVFSPLLDAGDFKAYMDRYNVSCAVAIYGINEIIGLVGKYEFSLEFYQYNELVFNTTSNTLINFDKDGNPLYFVDGTEAVYIGSAPLIKNKDYTVGRNPDTDMQFIAITTPSFTIGTQVVVRVYEKLNITKIDTVRNQIILDKLITKPYEVRLTYNNTTNIINAKFNIVRYGDAIHHYNYNGTVYISKPIGVDPLKLFQYTWEEYEIAVNEDKRNIRAIKPEYKSDLLSIIQDQAELLRNVRTD